MRTPGVAVLLPVLLGVGGDVAPHALRFHQQSIPAGKGPRWVSVADVNHDGDPDILVANADDGSLTVLLGNGRGQFHAAPGSPFPAGPQPNDIALADMNGDGNLDVIIPNHQAPTITILLGDGKGGFHPAPGSPFDVHSYPHPHGVAVADFDGDGKPDVVTDSWGNNRIELLLGDGKGGLRLPGRFFGVGKRPYERLRSADFNHDGHPDIVTTNLDDNTVTILLGDGKGGFHEATGSPFPAGAKPWQAFVGDVEGDGHAELVVIPYQRDLTSDNQNLVTVLLGNGRGGFAPMAGTPLALGTCRGANSVTAGQLAPGRRVIAVACAESRNLMVYERRPGGAWEPTSVPTKGGWGSVELAPVARDGHAALITADADAGSITIFTLE